MADLSGWCGHEGPRSRAMIGSTNGEEWGIHAEHEHSKEHGLAPGQCSGRWVN